VGAAGESFPLAPTVTLPRRFALAGGRGSGFSAIMGRSQYKILQSSLPHFLTCTVVRWIPLFERNDLATIVLDSLRFLQRERRIVLFAYVIMKDHVHLVASSNDLGKEVGDLKSYTARRIIDTLKLQNSFKLLDSLRQAKLRRKSDREFQVWQEGSHPQGIQGNEMMRQKIEYTHNNTVRKGYVLDAVEWEYSSARNYAGQQGLIDVTFVW
jgi:REP element-mobilizing transposase RayT